VVIVLLVDPHLPHLPGSAAQGGKGKEGGHRVAGVSEGPGYIVRGRRNAMEAHFNSVAAATQHHAQLRRTAEGFHQTRYLCHKYFIILHT